MNKKFTEWSIEDKQIIFHKILNSYFHYFVSIKESQNYTAKTIHEVFVVQKNNSSLNKIIDRYISEDLQNCKFPIIKMHGDLWQSNILLNEEEKILYIDLEHSDNYLFLYDLLYLPFSEIRQKSSDCSDDETSLDFLNLFMSNEFDQLFEKIFKIFGLEFDIKKKAEYLSLVLLNHFVYFNDTNKHFNFQEAYNKLLTEFDNQMEINERL